jgi:hypothetical protein
MTYRSRAGRQFVVVATGGGEDAALVAFAMEKDTKDTKDTKETKDTKKRTQRGQGTQ